MALIEIILPSPLIDFITAHETVCDAGCCGEDAFDLAPETIAENPWTENKIAKLDLTLVQSQLEAFQREALHAKGEPANERLNLCWTDHDAIRRWCAMIGDLITSAKAHLASKK